ncbi:MAG: biotin/lipoyl-containing protein [Brevinema sp.]
MSKIYQVKVDGNIYEVEVELLSEKPTQAHVAPVSSNPTPAPSGQGTPVTAPIQGNIWKVLTKVGDTVQEGQTIFILEAMKMENNIVAPKSGTITSISVKEGDNVSAGAILAELA